MHQGVKQAPDLIRKGGLIESLQELGKLSLCLLFGMHVKYNNILRKVKLHTLAEISIPFRVRCERLW